MQVCSPPNRLYLLMLLCSFPNSPLSYHCLEVFEHFPISHQSSLVSYCVFLQQFCKSLPRLLPSVIYVIVLPALYALIISSISSLKGSFTCCKHHPCGFNWSTVVKCVICSALSLSPNKMEHSLFVVQ